MDPSLGQEIDWCRALMANHYRFRLCYLSVPILFQALKFRLAQVFAYYCGGISVSKDGQEHNKKTWCRDDTLCPSLCINTIGSNHLDGPARKREQQHFLFSLRDALAILINKKLLYQLEKKNETLKVLMVSRYSYGLLRFFFLFLTPSQRIQSTQPFQLVILLSSILYIYV